MRELVGDDDFDADLLLAPHRLYLDDVRTLRAQADVKALAHVTGGGILGNLTRVLPDGVHARIDWDAWERPPVFDVARRARRRRRGGARASSISASGSAPSSPSRPRARS